MKHNKATPINSLSSEDLKINSCCKDNINCRLLVPLLQNYQKYTVLVQPFDLLNYVQLVIWL